MSRAQVYLDVSISEGGGGQKPDGTPTPRVDFDYYFKALKKSDGALVLDPGYQSRWFIQSALRDAFGWDGRADAKEHHIERLRDLAGRLDYLPPWMVHKAVVLDHHDKCPMPHGDD